MTLLPIVERELRVSSRRWRTYWGRTGAAALLLVLGAFIFSATQRLSMQQIGQILFIYLTGATGLMCLLSGPATTADCLSVERREGTLGFLFLTDLRAYDILLGKLAANSLRAVYSLIASLPMLAVPMLMGGVGLNEFLRLALVLANTLLFSLTVGLLSSTVFKTAQNSVGWSVISIAALAVGLPIFAMLWAENCGQKPDPVLMLASPGFAFATGLELLYPRYAAGFWLSNGIIFSLSLLCLLAAARILPHVWQDRPATPKRQRWRDAWRNWVLGRPAARAAYRQEALNVNAFFWLVTRPRYKPMALWIALGFIAALWLGLALYHRGIWMMPETFVGTAVVLMYMFRLLIASDCVQTIAEARSAGALELLLSTPLTVPDILRGQWLALEQTFLRPLFVTLAGLLILFMLSLSHHEVRREPLDWLLIWGCGTIVFITDLVATFCVGLWSALTAKNAQQASGMVMGRVFLLPWVIFGGVTMCASLFWEYVLQQNFNPPTWCVILLWFVLSVVSNALMARWAWRCLHERFRLVAMSRYEAPTPLWQKIWTSRSLPPTS